MEISFNRFPFGTEHYHRTAFSTNSPVYQEVGINNLPSVQENWYT